jgi:CheY-like chemotaxis protein
MFIPDDRTSREEGGASFARSVTIAARRRATVSGLGGLLEAKLVLVVSRDALAAALLGALVELEGYAPHFVRDGEPARDALRRVRPVAVLVDCDFPEGCGAAVLGPAKMIGAGVVLFGRPAVAALVAECAERFGVPVLTMPPAPGELAGLLDRRAAL